MTYHEAANIFPLNEEHIDELAADIKRSGLQVPIETLDGEIIDGRRRYLACQRAGVEPQLRAVKIKDPVGYVVSINLHRRHLTPAQRAMCAARTRELYDRRAKDRQRQSEGRGKKGVEPLPHLNSDAGKARDQVGKVFGVSGKTVDHATKVINTAVPEVVLAVDEGRMAVSTAAILATEPEDVQRAEAANPLRRRNYKSVSNPLSNGDTHDEPDDEPAGEIKGVGVIRAHEAINCLTRIPKNDALRKRGFQVVTDWIRHNG